MNHLFIILSFLLLALMMGCVGSQAGGGDASGPLDFDDSDFVIEDIALEDDPTPVEVSYQ